MSEIYCPFKCGQQGKYFFCRHDIGEKYPYTDCGIYKQMKELEEQDKLKDVGIVKRLE